MDKVEKIHQEAMNLAELAFSEKLRGNLEESNRQLKKAYVLETQAAKLVVNNIDMEPTRSILFRSAASLALECDDIREAERLIAFGLTGNPPEEIADELRNLLEVANFSRHLRLKGIALERDELQLSITGNEVSYGMVRSECMIYRIDNLKKLLHRTVLRKTGRPYQERGALPNNIQENFPVFLSIPRAASFAVTLKLSKPINQKEFDFVSPAEEYIDEVLYCIGLFENSKIEELKNRISDDAYFNNFVGLTRQLAPDGESVKQVGLTVLRNGSEKHVTLLKQNKKIITEKTLVKESDTEQEISLTGTFQFADSLSKKEKIKLLDDEGKPHTLIVPKGMMIDIVKPLWADLVDIVAVRRGNEIHLKDIHRAEG